jgi:hypothetical protein
MSTPIVRRAVPMALLPLTLVAGVLAATPWLRSFPSDVVAVPLYGAAILSPLVPAVTVRFGVRRVWASLLIDVVAFVVYALLAALHDPLAFSDLIDGLFRGPSQILTFALPLVSPRSLLVVPVALAWLAGAIAGECFTRRWFTVLPYPALLLGYGLAYAATVRAAESGAPVSRQNELVIAGLLLGTLLLMRVAQTWVRQDETSESTQADGILPMRGLVVGAVTTVVVALVASLAAQSSAFTRTTTTPQRVPSVDDSKPLTPVAFVASLRPADDKAPGVPVFTVQTSRDAPGYFGIAHVDSYDGEGWSFDRTFRPSGGVLPDDTDASLRLVGATTTQAITIAKGPLAGTAWMPYLYRPQKVTGASVNIDPASGMIVPAGHLAQGEHYEVESRVSTTTFDRLGKGAVADTSTGAQNTALLPGQRQYLADAIQAFSDETGVPSSPAIPFLQALQKDLQTRYSLYGTTSTAATTPVPPTGTSEHRLVEPQLKPTGKRTPAKSTHPKTTPAKTPAKPTTPTATPTSPAAPVESFGPRQGTTGLSDVLASIVLGARTGTAEQYATLVALLARQLGVPARLVTGFRVSDTDGGTLRHGRYEVTTKQAWTWVEIPIVGQGWVVLDAAPSSVSNARASSSAAASPSPTPTSSPTQNVLITKSNGGHAIAPKSEVPAGPGASHKALVIALLITFGALVLAALLLLLLRKGLRRRRRQRDPDPRARVVGAWRESIDVLTEAGLPDLTNLTSTEIAGLAGAQFGADPGSQVSYIGQTANSAAYSTALLVGPQDADAAWQAEKALRRQVNRQLGFGGRFAAWLRYHRNPHVEVIEGPRSWATESAGRHAASRKMSRLRRRGH